MLVIPDPDKACINRAAHVARRIVADVPHARVGWKHVGQQGERFSCRLRKADRIADEDGSFIMDRLRLLLLQRTPAVRQNRVRNAARIETGEQLVDARERDYEMRYERQADLAKTLRDSTRFVVLADRVHEADDHMIEIEPAGAHLL